MHPSLLQNISQPSDLKRLNSAQIQQLCGEIRQFLLDSVSKTGGHLASNLGAVELTDGYTVHGESLDAATAEKVKEQKPFVWSVKDDNGTKQTTYSTFSNGTKIIEIGRAHV